MDWLSPLKEVFGLVVPIFVSLPVVRAFLGIILVFFLPGFAWTLVFFPRVNPLERVALSLGLSIAMVTLSILSLNKLVGLRVAGFNSVMIIMVITIIPVVYYYLKRSRQTD